jgi:hypothetical protein
MFGGSKKKYKHGPWEGKERMCVHKREEKEHQTLPKTWKSHFLKFWTNQ